MSSTETILKKKPALLTPLQPFDPARHIAPNVAHELNNILTIVQGYTDRLLLRHGQNPALMPDLKLISEAARRAAIVVRNAKAASSGEVMRQNSPASMIGG
ncbi:MAG: hypothetical protein WDM80_06500 [Limisphaerales bacterium]